MPGGPARQLRRRCQTPNVSDTTYSKLSVPEPLVVVPMMAAVWPESARVESTVELWPGSTPNTKPPDV